MKFDELIRWGGLVRHCVYGLGRFRLPARLLLIPEPRTTMPRLERGIFVPLLAGGG